MSQRNVMSQDTLLSALDETQKGLQLENLEFQKLHLDGGEFSFVESSLTNVDFVNTSTEVEGRSIFIKCANFTKAALNNVKANVASLLSVKFIRAKLQSVELESTNMAEADFTKARLSKCVLDVAYLRSANFTGARILQSSLRYANLESANLTNVKFYDDADLTDTDKEPVRGYIKPKLTDFTGAHLYGANLQGADFSNVILVGANLRNANLKKADLAHAHFFPEDIAELDAVTLYQILNRYEHLYCSTDHIDRNLKLLKKLICADLIRKIYDVYSEYGAEEASRLYAIAIDHPFFATNRSSYKIDSSKLTTSQKKFMKEKVKSDTNDLVMFGDKKPRQYIFNESYIFKISQLNSGQLSDLIASHQSQIIFEWNGEANDDEFESSNLMQQYNENTLASRLMNALRADAKDINAHQLALDIDEYLKVFGEEANKCDFYRSLEARLHSLQENKAELILQLCTVAEPLQSRTKIKPPSRPNAYCNLRGADLRNLHLQKSDLRDANMSGAILIKTNLSLAMLDRANLTNTVFFPTEDFTANTATELLNSYADFYINSPNLKYMKPVILRDLLSKVKTSTMSTDEKSAFLKSIVTHKLFAEHQNKHTKRFNNFLSFFRRKQVIYTNTQKNIEAEIQSVAAPAA